NLALVHALPLSQIAGDQMPAGKAATMVFGPHGDNFIRVLMIVSMISGINAYHLMASRIPYAMATDGLLTRHAAKVNRGGTPTTALLLTLAGSLGVLRDGSSPGLTRHLAF